MSSQSNSLKSTALISTEDVIATAVLGKNGGHPGGQVFKQFGDFPAGTHLEPLLLIPWLSVYL